MKKLITISAFFLFSTLTFAAGPYDGIWSIHPYGYVTLSEKDGKLIYIGLSLNEKDGDRDWGALWGERIENKVNLVSLINTKVDIVADLVLTSDTTFKITQISCTPISTDESTDTSADTDIIGSGKCTFTDGFVIEGNKVW